MANENKSLSDRIKQSTANRNAMRAHFGGFVPLSVLKISRGALSRSVFSFQAELPNANPDKAQDLKSKRAQLKAAGYTGSKSSPSQKACGRGKSGLSTMPAELVDFFIKYYAAPGQTYLDPFMGQGVQMQVAKLRGLHYWGYDLCAEFFTFIEHVRDVIDDKRTTLKVFHGDSRSPEHIPDNCGDFSFHSPPYWDIEDYGDDARQLGMHKTYTQFLQGMHAVAAAWLPKFKRGAYHIVNINDFRKDGRFYAYHADIIQLFAAAGWTLSDTWIIDGLVGGMSKAFAVDFNMKKIAPKTHEYALVFRKG